MLTFFDGIKVPQTFFNSQLFCLHIEKVLSLYHLLPQPRLCILSPSDKYIYLLFPRCRVYSIREEAFPGALLGFVPLLSPPKRGFYFTWNLFSGISQFLGTYLAQRPSSPPYPKTFYLIWVGVNIFLFSVSSRDVQSLTTSSFLQFLLIYLFLCHQNFIRLNFSSDVRFTIKHKVQHKKTSLDPRSLHSKIH